MYHICAIVDGRMRHFTTNSVTLYYTWLKRVNFSEYLVIKEHDEYLVLS